MIELDLIYVNCDSILVTNLKKKKEKKVYLNSNLALLFIVNVTLIK